MKAMARQRSHSIEFKRQVAQEFIAGETLYGLSKRHDISRQLIASVFRGMKPAPWTKTPRLPISCRDTKPRSRRWSAWSAGRRRSGLRREGKNDRRLRARRVSRRIRQFRRDDIHRQP